MWKKVLIAFIALIGVCTAGYAYYSEKMTAAGNSYHAGGELTGRINRMPNGLNSTTASLQKGDKILMNVDNPYTSEKLAWQLLERHTYDDYGCTDKTTCTGNSAISNWAAMTDKPIAKVKFIDNSEVFKTHGRCFKTVDVRDTNVYTVITSFNELLKGSADDASLIRERNLSIIHESYSTLSDRDYFASMIERGTFAATELMLDNAFIASVYEAGDAGVQSYIAPNKDLTFSEDYTTTDTYHDIPCGGGVTSYFSFFLQGTDGISGNRPSNVSKYANNSYTRDIAVRPAIYLHLDNAVFAVSRGNGSGIGKVHLNHLSDGYTSLYNETTEDKNNGKNVPMKLRMYNSALNAQLNGIKHSNGTSITKITKNQTVKLEVSANAGNDGKGGIYTVSALVFDQNNNFIYYQPLGNATGNGTYEFDLTDIAVGKYKIAVVNEAYNESVTSPADSSLISNAMSLEIVDYVSLTATPKTGLEYGVNVNKGDTVATFITKDGVDPITTTLISDTTVNGHENDYQHFSLDNGNIIVSDPNGLNAGDYYFKLHGVDVLGAPVGGVDSSTIHIQVAKTDLTIAFDDSNQTKKSVRDATTPWNETATPIPSDGVKITYTKVGGDIGLIDIDEDTGEITYKGNGAYGKVTIRATADDDPDTGNDNYNSAFVEKEIVIYAQVEGSVTPDPKSSDPNTPTFTANDDNVKIGGIIGTIKGEPGTPDNVTSGGITYTYGIKNTGDSAFFEVDSRTGVIKTKANLAVESYTITVTVSDKWSTKEIPVTINVGMAAAENLQFYENKASSKVINTKTVNFTDTNVEVFATVKGSSNANPVKYEIKDSSTNVITINPTSGAITIKGTGTVTIIATKKGANGQADAKAELTFTVKPVEQNFIYTTDSTLTQEMPKNSTTGKYLAYEITYEPNGTFTLYTKGNPEGSQVTYRLKAGSPEDVISVDSDGTIHILNASMSVQIGKVFVEATSHDPNGNYDDKTIELPITIKKANQTVAFAEDPIYATSGKGSVTPVIDAQDISSNAGGATVEDTKTLISIDSSVDKAIAKTTDGQTITYNYDKEGGIDIPIHVIKQGNRNYEKAEADGTLHIMGPDESILIVSDVGEVEYGEHFFIESLQDDSASVNVKYTFTVDDTTYITSPTVNGNQAEFDAVKITGSKKVTITITRTADSEKPLSVKKQITVVPKEIEITIEDKEKLKGEVNPPLTYEDFSDQLVEWNGTKDDIQAGDVKLSTTANQTSPAGDYPIKGDANYLNKTYPNYQFTFVEGTLTIKEENIEDDWYHMETDDGQPYQGDWTNQDVNIVTDHDEYVNLSKDQSSWNKDFVSVTQEGNYEQSFWMKKDSGAITSEKKETIKIDKTSPKVKNIQAKDSNNKLQDIINKLSGGIFFKPGTSFEITTEDKNGQLDISGTESIEYKIYKQESDKTYSSPMKQDTLTVSNEKANITISETTGTYEVCVIPTDKAGNTGTESCHEVTLKKINEDVDDDDIPDFIDTDDDGCPDVSIKWKDDDGKWVVINGDLNNDKIPDYNIDSDGDGIPDLNVDTDHDGKPDLNLVILKKSDWQPKICVKADADKGIKEEYCTGTSVKPQINVDLDDDGIPDINIDNKGDFKPHLNISKDGKIPSINIVKLHTWTPNKNYQSNKFTYDSIGDSKSDPQPEINLDTDNDGRPDINLDLDGDGTADINIDSDGDRIPDLNIDSTGDGKPDINVDVSGNGYPEENIIKITEWKPEHNVDDPFPYDTMKFESKKELENNGVKVEKPEGTFPMNVTLKVTDITKDKQSEVSEKAKDLIGEQSVVQVFDVKLLENGKEIQPDGTIKVKIPVKANIKNPSLLILNENGEYENVDATFENGYLIYETDHLGQFTIIGEIEDQEPIDTDVKGTYYPGDNMGGALTGDTTNMMMYMGLGCMSIGMMLLVLYKKNQED